MLAAEIILLMFFLLAIGTPVGFTLLISGGIGLWFIGGWPILFGVLKTSPASTPASYELITVPMFLLMAELIVISGIAERLFTAARVWVGRLPGGLAVAAVMAGAAFGALSGSSTASAATLSAISVPAMLREGYEPKFATGVVAISGTLAILIPPSIALVIYGIIAGVNIGALLIAGVLPGLLVMMTIVATVFVLVALKPERAPVGPSYSWRTKLCSLKVAGPVSALFVAVTGVIYLGITTPTEAAALGAFGALVLVVVNRAFDFKSLAQALYRAAAISCMILLIVMGAHVFGTFLALTQTTQNIVAFIGGLGTSPWVIMCVLLFMYLVLGFFMDQIAILVLTIPVALPVVQSIGYDPVWFGVVVVVMAEIGLVTPPLGLNVFVVSKYTDRPLQEVFLGVMPHCVAHLLAVSLLVIFPQIVLWLPSTMKAM